MVEYSLVYLDKVFDNKLADDETHYEDKHGGLYEYTEEKKFEIMPKSNKNNEVEKKVILACITMYNEPFNQLKDTLDKMIDKNFDTIEEAEIEIIIVVDGLEQFYKEISKDEKIIEKFKCFFDVTLIINKLKLNADFEFKYLNTKIIEIEQKEMGSEHQGENEMSGLTKEVYQLKREYGHLFKSIYKDININFLVKHQNMRKLNSHLWFFSGFCRMFKTDYCFMIDVGTEAGEYALRNLFEELKNGSTTKPKVAGVCGEIVPMMNDTTFLDILVHAQKVEYKFSHILDKALESVLGFISVLPGAFSGYNYECLEPNNKNGPLWDHYFYSMQVKKLSCFKANIYLAEDRILCYALISSKDSDNILKYSSAAKAYTDVPNNMSQLLAQRRRWINGSWFASLYSICMCFKICKTKHTCCRKTILILQMLYSTINVFYSFFIVGAFYLAFSICVRKQLRSNSIENDRSTPGTLLVLFYLMQLMVLVILSLGTVAKHAEQAFKSISVVLTFYMALFMLLLVGIIIENIEDLKLTAFVIGVSAAFIIILCINKSLFQTALSIIQFLIATPIYVNVFNIYAMCNIHDVSWGNRPDKPTEEEREKVEDFKKFRAAWVLLWAYTNGFLAYLLDALDSRSSDYGNYVLIVGYFGIIVLLIRFLGGVYYACFVKKHDFLKSRPNN